MIVVLLGAPGSGKGTQAKVLAQAFDLGHVSTGDLLRAESQKNTPLGLHIQNALEQGSYVDDHCIMGVLRHNFQDLTEGHKGCVLDGLPRTLAQANALDIFLKERAELLTAVILIDVPRELLIERLTGRFMCRKCQSVYHKVFRPPLKPGVCDQCGSQDFYVREDDRADVVSKRLDHHQEQIEPLLAYYKAHALLRTVDGSQDIPLVSKQILDCLSEV